MHSQSALTPDSTASAKWSDRKRVRVAESRSGSSTTPVELSGKVALVFVVSFAGGLTSCCQPSQVRQLACDPARKRRRSRPSLVCHFAYRCLAMLAKI